MKTTPSEAEKEETKKQEKFIFNPKKIPTQSGCYLFFDREKKLLYVGKAKNLRKRVTNYFQKNKKSIKTKLMVSKITSIETKIVHSETEALVLENNLIKQFKPRFNILLRDDKNFLYLSITKEPIPRLEITRRIVRDGSFYIGPKTSAKSFRKTIHFCQKVFQIRDCHLTMDLETTKKTSNPPEKSDFLSDKEDLNGLKSQSQKDQNLPKIIVLKNPEKRTLPCIDFHLKKCSAPCTNEITPEGYRASIEAMKKFLRGSTQEVLKELKTKMMVFAQDKKFEAAAKIRDLIQSIEISTEKQSVQFFDQLDRDFIHYHQSGKNLYIIRIIFRNGKLLEQNEMTFRNELQSEESSETKKKQSPEFLSNILIQMYERVDTLPQEIYIPKKIPNSEILSQFLTQNLKIESPKNHPKILVPQKGEKKKILEMAYKNAKAFAERTEIENMSHAENFAKALPSLAQALELKTPPRRIEGYDISHFSGSATVASQVVFIDGKPKNSAYRRFHIKDLPKNKIDDFASLNEVLTRRFKGLKNLETQSNKDTSLQKEIPVETPPKEALIKAPEEKQIPKKSGHEETPDLILIDGGKGQLSSVIKIFETNPELLPKNFNPEKQIISLAKKEELIYRAKQKDPLTLDYNDPALKLLQRIRDESHRFAISFNRSIRQKNQTKSILDEIPSIGPSTKKKLMQKFQTVSGIRESSDETLLGILNRKQLAHLRKTL